MSSLNYVTRIQADVPKYDFLEHDQIAMYSWELKKKYEVMLVKDNWAWK